MGHLVGTVQPVSPAAKIGPDSGLPPAAPNTWAFALDPGTPAIGKVKFVLVHFRAVNLPGNNRVEVDLGYGTDVFTSASGADFWSRPVNVGAFVDGKVPVRYITNGAATGSVDVDRFGRGERHDGDGDPTSNSNCDPFLLDAQYVEPTFNPSLFCTTTPDFENIDCVAAANDVRRTVAPAAGMIVHVDLSADGLSETLSTFSGTLVGTDLVLTVAQHLVVFDTQIKSSSIIFNYQTTCAGGRPAGYAGEFFKVKRVVRLGFFGAVDYALLQLEVPAAGLGITPVVMRPDVPAAGEEIFCIHHPEGAVKRLSASSATFKTVISSNIGGAIADLDVASGSTGAGLFDAAGKVVGVMSTGTPCNISFFPTAGALIDIGEPLGDPLARDVMIVLDRSGSMGLDAGSGLTKIEEARDAASLFIQLVQGDGANRIGLVSFSTTASNPVDFALTPVDTNSKLALTGPAPFDTGIVGAIVPGGNTSIGDGLEVARDQLSIENLRSILLLTDGLENTPPLIADVTGLDGIDINAVGFGQASSLNGTLLTQLSESHNGIYMRAGDGLDLKKFFSLAFGNIFASGALLDPKGRLKANDKESKPIKFGVCGEEAVTVVVGWNGERAPLSITVRTPGGVAIDASTPGVTHATGRTWAFLRISLPYRGERNGIWTVTIHRVERALAVPRAVDFFVNVIAGGGAKFTRWPGRDLYFTGEEIKPVVHLAGRAGCPPTKTKVALTVSRPAASIGTVLSKAKKAQRPATQSGEALPSRQATLLAIEKSTRKPIVDHDELRFDLTDDPAHTGFTTRSAGLYGATLKDFLKVEGTYTFHAVVTYGATGRRELQWSAEVAPGIDQARSGVKVSAGKTVRKDKKRPVTFTIVPRDRYGNHVGPGRPEAFTVTGAPGTTLIGALRDNGDGSYAIAGLADPGKSKPGVVLGRPERGALKRPSRRAAKPPRKS